MPAPPGYLLFSYILREVQPEVKPEVQPEVKPEVFIDERPKRFRTVTLTMKTGESVTGRVMHIEKTTPNWFFLNDGIEKYRPIDMTTVYEWLYED